LLVFESKSDLLQDTPKNYPSSEGTLEFTLTVETAFYFMVSLWVFLLLSTLFSW